MNPLKILDSIREQHDNAVIVHCFYLTLFSLLWCVLDKALRQFKSRWYMLHLIANSINVFFTVRDTIGLFLDPLFYKNSHTSLIPPNVTVSLHVYHVIAYSNIQTVEWVHHIVMMFALSFSYFFPIPELNNFTIFFVCGFPGAIDYALLIWTKEFNMDSLIEKKYNSYINVWIRAPGIIIAAFILYIRFSYNFNSFPFHIFIIIFCALFWNSLYFMFRVVENYGYARGRRNYPEKVNNF